MGDAEAAVGLAVAAVGEALVTVGLVVAAVRMGIETVGLVDIAVGVPLGLELGVLVVGERVGATVGSSEDESSEDESSEDESSEDESSEDESSEDESSEDESSEDESSSMGPGVGLFDGLSVGNNNDNALLLPPGQTPLSE